MSVKPLTLPIPDHENGRLCFAALRPIGLATLAFLFTAGTLHAQIDNNSSGMSDVWETVYGVGLDPDADPDGDGFTNREEAAAGTNPFDPASHPKAGDLNISDPDAITHSWPTVAGIHYQTMVSTDLVQWQPIGPGVIGTGGEHSLTLQPETTFTGGGVQHSRWNFQSGDLSTVKNYASQGTPAPDIQSTLTRLQVPASSPNENLFGQWIRGWIIAPETGNYRFWIASDDDGELWLSPSPDPAQKLQLAYVDGWTGANEWTKFESQQSAPVPLVANQAYYFEIFHREYSGGDHLSVAWTRPAMQEGTREIISGNVLSSTGESLASMQDGGSSLFFRLKISHTDSDGDGVSDYEEHLLGLHPGNTTTTPRLADLEAAQRILTSASTLTLGVSKPRAYKEGPEEARFIVFRAGGIKAFTANYSVSGSAIAGEHFEALSGEIHFAPGQRFVEIPVTPIQNNLLEPQQTVTLTLGQGDEFLLGNPANASITIDDAPDVLYVAQLRSAPGLNSSGSGAAAVRKAGNSFSSLVNLSFTGLSGPQISAEIFYSQDGIGGPAVFVFPQGQVPGMDWAFEIAGGLSREQIIAALTDGHLWVRITTAEAGGAEVLGQLVASPGWETMPDLTPPPAPPSMPADIGDAARFLTQATFGPTEASLSALADLSYSQWIDQQLALPASFHRDDVVARANQWYARGSNSGGWQGPRNEIWWQRALTAPDQLRQRMAFALSQIFVISQFGALDGQHEGVTLYYDMLLEHSFGNYRDLLEDVTLSPMMGTYLSMIRNRKPNPVTGHEPDENYAREVMQLFSVGLSRMHSDGSLQLDSQGLPIPTYTQDETVGLAHIFTGWGPHYDDANPPTWGNGSIANRSSWFVYGNDPLRPMSYYSEYHDTLERTILGGEVIAASTDGEDRMQQALDAIFHHPNIGPFIAKQLIQKFVTSNPSPGYIHRVASAFNDDGTGVRGNLGATLRAVLLDYEARHPTPRASYSYGKSAEPLLRMSRMFRLIPGTLPRAYLGDQNYYFNFQSSLPEQAPLLSPSVFNFFQPGYSNPGAIARAGLLSPELQIFGETNGLRQANQKWSALTWAVWTPERNPANTASEVFRFDFTPFVNILNTPGLTPVEAQSALVDHLDDRFLFGEMSPELRAQILAVYANLPANWGYSTDRQTRRARAALYLILNSPEFFVQK